MQKGYENFGWRLFKGYEKFHQKNKGYEILHWEDKG